MVIGAPDRLSFCNLKLAIACVMYASGASGLIDEYCSDDDRGKRHSIVS